MRRGTLAQGITLLEVLIVLALVAMASGFATLKLTNQEELLFLRRLVAHMQFARIRAMEGLAMARIVFEPEKFTLESRTERKEAPVPADVRVRLPGASSANASQNPVSVTFHADGSTIVHSGDNTRESALDVVFATGRTYRISFNPFEGVRCTRMRPMSEAAE